MVGSVYTKYENLFLNYENKKQLINYYKLKNHKISKIIFEDKFNWDFCLYTTYKEKNVHGIDDNHMRVICCDIKPMLNDNFLCILRKMENQIELMKINNNMHTHVNDMYMYQYGLKSYNSETTKYILLIELFASKSTSKEELKKIFKQSNIDVIFTDELLEEDKK